MMKKENKSKVFLLKSTIIDVDYNITITDQSDYQYNYYYVE